MIVVAIPTLRRPTVLKRLLDCSVDQGWARSASVVVLDNDLGGSAERLRGHPGLARGTYLHVTEPGVAAVRNAGLQHALQLGAECIIFIDDDVLPEAGWFDALVDARSRWCADVVVGPIRQNDEVFSKAYARAALRRNVGREDGPVDGDLAGGNMLVDLGAVRRFTLEFDATLGESGGEDTHFGRLVRLRGGLLVYSSSAVVTEQNSVDSVTPMALLKRSYRNGRALTRIDRKLNTGAAAPTRAAALIAVCSVAAISVIRALGRGDAEQMWRQLFRVARHCGQVRGGRSVLGGHYQGLGRTEFGGTESRARPCRTVSVGPFEVADETQPDIVETLASMIGTGRARTGFALHVGGLNSRKDNKYVAGLTRGDITYADGMAVVLLARLGGAGRIERASTTDVGWLVLRRFAGMAGRPTRVALVGGPVGLAARAGARLAQDPAIHVVCTRSGYVDDWAAEFQEVSHTRPDVVLLGVGSPLEVVVADEYGAALPPCLILTCGGWFGFLAGDEKRAPRWAHRMGLEWVARVAQSPRRLASRYATGVASVAAIACSTRRHLRRNDGDRINS